MTRKQATLSAALLVTAVQFCGAPAALAQQVPPPATAATPPDKARAAGNQAATPVQNAPAQAPAAQNTPAQTAPAQTAPAQAGRHADNPSPPGDQSGNSGGGAPGGSGLRRAAVHAITGVEVFHSSLQPPIDVIRVTGLASSTGWNDPELVAIGTGMPSDGILDLLLTASAPDENADADGFAPMEAILPIEPEHGFKGVRVRSATNALTLHEMPGHVEGRAPTQDCGSCVGKLFVAKGQSVPPGATPADTIRPDDLPPDTIVIKPTDGLAQRTPDPNRLTIMLGDDGRIVDVFWN